MVQNVNYSVVIFAIFISGGNAYKRQATWVPLGQKSKSLVVTLPWVLLYVFYTPKNAQTVDHDVDWWHSDKLLCLGSNRLNRSPLYWNSNGHFFHASCSSCRSSIKNPIYTPWLLLSAHSLCHNLHPRSISQNEKLNLTSGLILAL